MVLGDVHDAVRIDNYTAPEAEAGVLTKKME